MAPARPKTKACDVAIAGGGPVGLTLALALARHGYESVVIDAAPAPKAGKPANDSRAFFIAYGCWRIFRALDLEKALLEHAEPVTSVEAEGRIGGISFLAEDCGSEPVLGYMIEAARLIPVLHEAAKADENIRLVAGAKIDGVTLGDPEAVVQLGAKEIRACLVIGCDGAKSVVRKAAGLRFEGWDYNAKAISTTVKLGRPHKGAARQIFLPGGPMAVLPLKDNRANLIWTERAAVADALVELDDRGFELELAKKAGVFLADAKLAGPRHAFGLGLHVAERFHAPRAALAGDSAHVIHPLGGQGLNLGLKDVAALVDVIVEAGRAGLDIGAESALEPYTRWRRADVAATAAAMEAFARIFSAPLPVRLAAGLAMQAAGSVREARKLFAREAGGDLGELPSLMRAG
jgi:2-octaprenyl-6-methoxyphenol hydroxylase